MECENFMLLRLFCLDTSSHLNLGFRIMAIDYIVEATIGPGTSPEGVTP
jgi:hypothetical protein